MYNLIKKEDSNKEAVLILLLMLCIISLFLSINMGAVDIDISKIIKAVFIEKDTVDHQIIYNVRLPRTLTAALVGICLSLSGAILQGIMRNPLAGTNIIGVSSGAGFMALVILILFPQYYYLVPAGSFLGALMSTLLIYLITWKNGIQPMRFILSGVAVSSFLNAGINSLMILFPGRVSGVIGFMVGGLSGITWTHFKMILPYAALGVVFVLMLPQKLNILMLGDEVATGLGLNVERTRFVFIVISSILAGSAVSVVGLLGFVGLIVPHIARLLIGSDYRYLFPATILLGASILLICDTLSRVLFQPFEIPVGIIMSVLGVPFFLCLLKERGSRQ